MDTLRREQINAEFRKVEAVLAATPAFDSSRGISTEEFKGRQRRVWEALETAGFDAGFVFSDEHYNGDVAYLSGNTNISIEQVAGVIGTNGFHIIAGLEGGYVVEQLAPGPKRRYTRSKCYSWQVRTTLLTLNFPKKSLRFSVFQLHQYTIPQVF